MSTLALDLATVTGWAVESCGLVTSGTVSFRGHRSAGDGARYLKFRRWLREVIETEKPRAVFYEEVRRHLGTDAAHVYGGLVATLQMECEVREIPYLGIPVGTIKKKATGRGNAQKADMIAAARSRWPDQTIADDNQADALWILECGRAA